MPISMARATTPARLSSCTTSNRAPGNEPQIRTTSAYGAISPMINKDNVLNGAQMLTMMGGIDHPGAKMRVPGKVRDAATGGNRTVDGSGAFLVGELERLDQTSHQPLASVTFHEDLPFRDDVTLGDEWTSFTQETFGTPGGAGTG